MEWRADGAASSAPFLLTRPIHLPAHPRGWEGRGYPFRSCEHRATPDEAKRGQL